VGLHFNYPITNHIEDTFILDSYDEKSLLELFETKTDHELLGYYFMLGHIFEDVNKLFGVNNYR